MTATLRGGIPKENWWTDSPIQPVIVCSTVDQIGSSLLFQAYGVSPYARPIRAGLAAYDSFIVLDEAHTSQPFEETLGWIKRYRGWGEQPLTFPLTVVEMSATPRGSEVLEETEKDRQNPILQRRWETEKKARAILEEDETEGKEDRNKLVKALAREARTLRDQHGPKVIGVIANRVETARRVFENLKDEGGCAALLLTGRARPYDRDRLWESWKTRIGLGREADPENTVFVVATQCIKEAPGLADLEGVGGPASSGRNEKGASRGPVLAWRGEEESEVLWRPEEIRPGVTIIVPAAYGGCDDWGWNPESRDEVSDVGDAVKWELGHPMLRLHPKLAEQWKYTVFAKRIQEEDSEREAMDALAGELDADAEHWVGDVVAALRGRARLVESPAEGGSSWAAAIGRSVFDQETRRASYTSEIPLAQHLEGCANWAARFASELPERLRETVIRAAALHDIGKADPRFQAWLRGGNPIRPDELLAKSGRNGQNPSAIERARKLAGYPKGGRHELMSVALLERHGAEFASLDFDLLLHLIASHHGRCRPFAPVVEEEAAAAMWNATSDHRLELAGSGVSERYWRLLERYGWYGLAFLETLVRLADQRQSEHEQVKSTAEAAHA